MKLGKTPLGDIVPSMYPIPQNPVTLAWNSYVNSQKKGVSGVGDFVSGAFDVPQNPVTQGTRFNAPKKLVSGQRNVLMDSMDRQTVAGTCGMGSLDVSSLTAFQNSLMSGTSFGVSNLMLVGGSVVALVLLMGTRGRR